MMPPETTANADSQTALACEHESARVSGSLDLEFRRDLATDRTLLFRCSQKPPLQVVRAFEREDGSALAHLHNVSGGVLGGDRLFLRASLGRDAQAQLTTTGSTRLYRPRAEAPAAIQVNELTIAENGLLEYVPDNIIPYAGSRFSQRTTIHLAEGAGLFWWEILAPGRQARGELFEYETLELKTDIFAAGRRISAERMRIEPTGSNLSYMARMGEYRYLASFHICRVGLDTSHWLAAEQRLREISAAMTKPDEIVWGISTLVSDGLLVRGLARQGRDMNSGVRQIWREAKLFLYGKKPIQPRKII